MASGGGDCLEMKPTQPNKSRREWKRNREAEGRLAVRPDDTRLPDSLLVRLGQKLPIPTVAPA